MGIRTVRQPAALSMGWLFTLPLSVALLLLVTSPAVAAGTRVTASGTFRQTSFVPSNVRSAGGVTLFDFTEHDTLSGTFSGTSVIRGSCVVRSSGSGVCHAVETFTGTVAGQPGTVQFQDVVSLSETGGSQGTFVIVGGTGDLANLHGSGTFQGIMGAGTYTAQVLFAP